MTDDALTDRVCDFMTPMPICVPSDTNITTLGVLFQRHRFRHLPVVAPDGALVGVASDFTVDAHGGLAGQPPMLWLPFEAGGERLCAGDLATDRMVTAPPDAPLSGILQEMLSARAEIVVVVDDARHPLGVLTEHDAVRLAAGLIPLGVNVSHQGTADVLSVDAAAPASHALRSMRRSGIRHLAVLRDRELIGVLSYRDLISDRAASEPQLLCSQVIRRRQPVVVQRGTELQVAARIMARERIGCLPVIGQAGGISAILTRTDITEALLVALEMDALFGRAGDRKRPTLRIDTGTGTLIGRLLEEPPAAVAHVLVRQLARAAAREYNADAAIDGLFEALGQEAPSFERELRALRGEGARLVGDLDQLAEANWNDDMERVTEVVPLTVSWAAYRRHLADLVTRVRYHETGDGD